MAVWNEPNPYTEYNDLIKKSMTFQYQLEDLTLCLLYTSDAADD